jgi:hypothetical protein
MRSMFSVVTPRIWVSPRSNSAEPCTRGQHADLGGQRPDVGEAAAVDADLVAQDALAHQLLGQRAERGADLLLAALELRRQRSSPGLDLGRGPPRAPACRRWSAPRRARRGRRGRRRPRRRRPGSPGRPGTRRSAWRPWRPARSAPRTARLMNGLAASRPLGDDLLGRRAAPPAISSIACSVASASTIMIATSPSAATRPATTMSKTAPRARSWVGNATHWPSISATRTPPIGPENGRPESWVDIEAALIATTSYRWSGRAPGSSRRPGPRCAGPW